MLCSYEPQQCLKVGSVCGPQNHITQKPASFYPNGDAAVLGKTKKGMRLTQNAVKVFKKYHLTELIAD